MKWQLQFPFNHFTVSSYIIDVEGLVFQKQRAKIVFVNSFRYIDVAVCSEAKFLSVTLRRTVIYDTRDQIMHQLAKDLL